MRKKLFSFLALGLLCLNNAYGQDCPDTALKNSDTISFRQQGEIFEIPFQVTGCEMIALELRWANGASHGSLFRLTFRDGENQVIYSKQLSGYNTGTLHFPFATLDPRPWYGSRLMISVPATVTIQAVYPFSFPASISYTVTRKAARAKERRTSGTVEEAESGEKRKEVERGKQGNEILSIHRAVRLIGSSRVPLVQIELKTARPFPVRDSALQLQIGKRLFLNELSGDHTGRVLTVNLTPEMFSDLEDGAEIVAFFGNSDSGGPSGHDIWHFGRLDKKRLPK